jgi:hypothetical protein
MSDSTRRILSFLALAVAAGLLFVADGTRYFDRNVLDSTAFADKATEALEKPAVRRELAREIVDQVEGRVPAASGRREELEAAADRMIETRQFRRIFRAGVREIHRLAFDDQETALLLDLREVDGPLTRAARRIDPEIASAIPPGFDARVAEISDEVDRTLGEIRDFSQRAGGVADITLLLGLILVALSVALATDRLRATIRVGWLMAALGLIYVVAYYLARTAIASELDDDVRKDAVKEAWDAVMGGLRDFNLMLLIFGLIVVVGTVLARGRLRDRNPEGWEQTAEQRW